MDIQLQVIDKELEEFLEERSDQIGITITNITATKSQKTPNNITMRIDTWPTTQQLKATQPVGKESLDQSSDPIPLLLSLHIQHKLQAFTQTLTHEALRYLDIGIHIGKSLANK